MKRDLARTLDLCQYHAPWLTRPERAAVTDFHRAVPHCLSHTPLDPLLTGPDDVASALREHAERIGDWHDALGRLLTDPRLAQDPNPMPYGSRPGPGPCSPAVTRFLRFASQHYHRQRQHFEYTVTRWALQLLPPLTYPDETRSLNVHAKALTILD